MKITFWFVTLLFFSIHSVLAQETTNPDDLLKKAQQKAYAKNYQEARVICNQILQKKDNYLDARILLARTYSWEHQYDSARYHLRRVLKQDNFALDGYLALADVEIWSSNCAVASQLCDSALARIPHNYDLMVKKTKACLCLQDKKCAQTTLDSILKIYPLNLEIQNLLKQLRNGIYKNRFIVEHTFEFFQKPNVRRWHVTSLQYQHDASWGTWIAKVNAGQLIRSTGKLYDPGSIQYEAEAYPLLGKGFYAWVNYGFCNEDLFPNHKAGLELFKTFKNGFEVSLGARYNYFKDNNNLWIYTASISKYYKSWWFSLRQYSSWNNDQFDQSYFAFARKYKTEFNYWGLMAGYGYSPDLLPTSALTWDYIHLNSYQLRFDYQHRLGKHFLFRTLTGGAYDEYNKSKYRPRFNTQIYLAYMF